MEVRQLEHFIAVVEEQHFTRAARRCNLSQSALSASIRSLERELGAPLFVRSTRTVTVTDEGRALLSRAWAVINAVNAAREAVDASRGHLSGSLRVGGIQTDGVIDQTELLAAFHERHPDVELQYTAGSSVELVEGVRDGALDLAFVSVPNRRPSGVDVKALASLPLLFLCRPDHPLAGAGELKLEQLVDETFVGGPHNSVATKAIARVYRLGGTQRRPMAEVSDVRTMAEFVAAGLGVALLPKHIADQRPPLVAVPLSDTSMIWTVGVVSVKAERRRAVTNAFLDCL
jgi:DNA-binding transcriptional LysR family regulator